MGPTAETWYPSRPAMGAFSVGLIDARTEHGWEPASRLSVSRVSPGSRPGA